VHDIQKLHQKYGPILRIAPNEVTFAHPEAWADIFQSRSDRPQFLKDPVWWATQQGQPMSLINAIDLENHARMRKVLTPGFTPRALRPQEPILHQYVNLLVERLRQSLDSDRPDESATVDIAMWFMFTTFDIFGDLGFGESFDCLQNSRYHAWIELLFNSVKAASMVAAARFYPAIEYILLTCIPPSLKKKALDHRLQIVDKVNRRRSFEMQRPDIMHHVIHASEDDSDKAMSLDEINSTFMVLTTAGSETTATVLGGTMNYLINNPAKLATLVQEIRGQFQNESEISLTKLQELTYLTAVLNEGLRLCPPVPWMIPRVVPEKGETVCGVWLPGGVSLILVPAAAGRWVDNVPLQTPVSIQAYTMNRDEARFHDASSFLPERWLPESATDPGSPFYKDQRHCMQPFSVGPRNCIGQHIAWAEMRLIMAKLLWNFDFKASKGEQLKWEDLRTFVLVEKRPIYVDYKLRATWKQLVAKSR
jgi:cytochrome P450